MKARSTLLKILLPGFSTAITLGLTIGNALAHDDKGSHDGYDHSGAPHEAPHKVEPPAGGHGSLAKAATNPNSDGPTATWTAKINLTLLFPK